MNYFDDLILCSILLYFPIICYLLYLSLNKVDNIKENDILFSIVLLVSCFLLVNRDITTYRRVQVLLSNVPFFIALTYKKPKVAFIICIMNMFYSQIHNSNYLLYIEEYLIYFIIYYLFSHYYKKNKLNFYLIVFYINKMLWYVIRKDLNNSFYSVSLHNDNFLITLPLCIIISYFLIRLLNKNEELIKNNKKMIEYEKNDLMMNSLYKVTHEIKNPLAVCKGYLEMLDINNHKKCEKYIPIIKKEVNHTLNIIKDFSDLKKINIEKKSMDLNILVNDVIESTKLIFEKNEIKLVYKNKNSYIIDGDYNRLRQVLENILKNSKEALENGDKKTIVIDLYNEENYSCITIENNGPSLSEDYLSKIGQAFYTTKTYGTGLGLLFSKEIIQKHNGLMEFESNNGFKTIIKIPKS